uniref:DNA-directed RNA polymerase subunit n=1 Tax=Davidia involucrata TaxID=16924 RepID=A0A5B7B2D8_DAVIN
MAQTTEGMSEIVEAVRLSFMTDEEVRRHSVVKITNPILLDSVERPVPGGLYDPAMGPLDDQTLCKSCCQRSFHCPGHCGHIDLISPVYNPLLFNMLHNLLQRTCFFCLHFRATRSQVENCVSQLELIAKGDIVGAKMLDSTLTSESVYSEDSDGSHVSCSTVRSRVENHSLEHGKKQGWTSIQFSEAKSALDKFMKLKYVGCKNCSAKNPTINKPTFGWFHMEGMSGVHTRANIIRDCKLEGPYSGGAEEKPASEVVNANDSPLGNGLDPAETDTFTTGSDGIEDSVTKKNGRKGKRVPLEFIKQKNFFSGPLLPSEVRDIVKILWQNEPQLCSFICDLQREGFNTSGKIAGYSMFFLETILVPPIKFRPASKGEVSVMEHPQTVLLGKVLQSNIALGNAHVNNSERSRIVNRWMDLQQSLNVLFDSKTASGQGQRDVGSGICQLLEKKEGLFRQKMMGKRVNYACRSVISPDPYLAVNEIGIPPYFALRLTYPERVTPWNVVKLRNAIINGSEIHPGATHYVDKLSTVKLPPSKKMRISISRKLPSSRGVVTQSGKSCDYEVEGKIVYRHLQDGDIVLVNRQPTLHKPSIMAHVVRVLKGEKTLRMHYANCSTYNADFDGDEMNVHFPQDEVSRAEAYNIVNANNQYIVPTRGDTVRGLIQDHIVSAVILTMKNTFLTGEEYNQLLYSSGVFAAGPGSFSGNTCQKVSLVNTEVVMQPVLPAVWKPKPLWTGKQVITAVLNHLTRHGKPFTVENEGKIPGMYFASEAARNQSSEDKEENAEHKLLIRKNELVRGVIDKAQFGKYGLVHTVQELYGSNTAGILLSVLSRLFTVFLQIHGFTCGVDDLLISPYCDIQRKEKLEGEDVGEEVHCQFVNFKYGEIGALKLQLEIEKAVHSNGQSATAFLDMKMKNKLSKKGSDINKDLLLKGLLKPFPKNCISLMTISGAKGSSVNFQQISSFLGQQELEGKRVPRMVSGKTLPCFVPWDFSSRAGGFITDRFLTGLRPQEYYFHCMAGREGLVDTAVKTSRSGYLQRCLVKNLECLKVCYDYTVRDADGSIIQFCYGEDGVDVHQTSFIRKFEALEANQEIICQKFHHQLEFNTYINELPSGLKEEARKFVAELPMKKKSLKLKKQDFLKLMEQKYLSSLAQSGEPVGVIAAQSIGEPSTQMTLNTFHLAGRGEMNVTLGIPRLQEILMTASNDIMTPIMTCPLLEGKSKKDAKHLVEKAKKVTVADMIECIEVHVLPLSIQNKEISRIYKLKMELSEHKFVSRKDWEETLEVVFLRELEDAIQNHLLLLSKIRGIKNFMSDSRSKASNETDDDASGGRSKGGEENDDDDDDGDGDGDERAEDLGFDAQKIKQQATDEMDYEDNSEDEPNEEEPSAELGKNTDQGVDKVEMREENEIGEYDVEDETSEMPYEPEVLSKPKSVDRKTNLKDKRKEKVKATLVKKDSDHKRKEKVKATLVKKDSDNKGKEKVKATLVKKDYDRAIFVEAKGLHFEVHFKFTNEPHVLLAQIAQKIAKKVQIKSSGKIDQCQVVDYDINEQVIWREEEKSKMPAQALKTAGVDFTAFWEMQDDLDVRHIYSNNIHAMLNTFGVEAARAALIREVKHVFKIYGVEIDFRHLSLIADYMTHSGGYRPMSRHGGIADSISPFLKMSFETASKFIVEAAYHGLTDNLETPSARVCLGLPVKMGTGCFDLMQKLEI